MNSDLKPCAHCGGDAIPFWEMAQAKVICRNVQCIAREGKGYDTEQEASDAWNARVDDWVPLSERPPEIDREVWATYIHPGDGNRYIQWCIYMLDDDETPTFVYYDGGPEPLGGVIAWRYIPEPYKQVDTPEQMG